MTHRLRLGILITPPLLVLLIAIVIPLAGMILFSVRADSFNLDEGYSLASYQEFFTDPRYLRLMGQTGWTAFIVAAVAVLLAYPVAYFLAFHSGRWKLTLIALMIVPAWTSYLLRILSWKVMLGSGGLLYSLLNGIGIDASSLPLLLYSPQAVVITLVYVWIPFAALPIFVTLDRLDKRLLEAANDLGASPLRAFWRVTLPISLPGVLVSFIYVFIPTFGDWVTPLLVGGAQGGILYGNIIQSQYTRALNWPLGSVLSIALLVLILVLLLLYGRITRALTGENGR
ncbi:MAG: ABC transporter permease [Chloroflexota bacterium]|nr:ABC transporter permease [Chloroflexota bacterium]